MKGENFIKNFAIIGLSTIINLILGLITTPIITRLVDPVEYGQLSIFTMYSSIALLVLCLGLDQALVRYYYKRKDLDYKKKLLRKCIKLPVICSFIASIIFILLVRFNIIHFEFNLLICVLLCFYTIVQLLYRFGMAIIRLEYKSKLYSRINVFVKLFYVLLAIPLILIIKKNYTLLLIIATIVSSFICLIICIVSQIEIWNFKDKCEDEDISFKQLFLYAYPYIISMGITTLFQAIDKISLNMVYSYNEVGIYSSTMSIVHIFAIIQTTFNTLWMPTAVKHYTEKPEEKEFYVKANNYITVVMFILGFSLIFVKDIFALFLGAKYREAAYILPFLIFNPIMYTISETTVCGLVFKEKSKMQIVVALGACVTNIIGNYYLVPILGCKGAAISTGISYIVFYLLRTLLSNKYYKINFQLKKMCIITGLLVAYAYYNTFYSFSIYSVIGYVIGIIAIIILYNKSIKEIIELLIKFVKRRKINEQNN